MRNFVTRFKVNRMTLLRMARGLGFRLNTHGTRGRPVKGATVARSERRRFAAYLAEVGVGPSEVTNYIYLSNILARGQCSSVQFCDALAAHYTREMADRALVECPDTVRMALKDRTPSVLSDRGQRQYRRVKDRLRVASLFA